MTITKQQLIPFYLMSCYLYYERDCQVLDDKEFDVVCSRIIDEWDDLEHQHKELITKENLVAQTGFNLEYPKIVMYSAVDWYKEHNQTPKVKKIEKVKEVKKEEVFEDIEDLFE